MNEIQAQTRVRRVIWLRRHRLVIQVFGTLMGGAVPLLLAIGLNWLPELLDLPGGLGVFAICFLVPLCVVFAIPGAIIGCGVANSITSQRVPYGYCRFCGYNLQHYTVPRCPECGKATSSEY